MQKADICAVTSTHTAPLPEAATETGQWNYYSFFNTFCMDLPLSKLFYNAIKDCILSFTVRSPLYCHM